jgi:DNA replication licensing factor MCM6
MNLNLLYKKTHFQYDILGEEVKRIFYNFLEFYDSNRIFFSNYQISMNFIEQSKIIIDSLSTTIFINFEHLIQFSDELSDIIQEQYIRLESCLRFSFNEFIRKNLRKNLVGKVYWISLYNIPNKKKFTFITSDVLNKLIRISGIVTRITDYYPKLILGTFECSNVNCSFRYWHIEQNFLYNEPKICFNCGNTNWILIPKDSIFAYFQKLRIQEIKKNFSYKKSPRTVDVYARYEYGERIKLGKEFIFSGCLLILPIKKKYSPNKPEPFSTENYDIQQNNFLKNLVRNICFSFYFWTCHFSPFEQNLYRKTNNKSITKKKNISTISDLFSREEREKIFKFRNNQNILSTFVHNFSLIYSFSQELKLAVLFTFIRGNKKNSTQQIKLRNKINTCIIDDSSYTKNKFINSLIDIFPRLFFINGKNSSLSGLTVSIVKDQEYNESFIEAGAFLLSNKSICFVDNFNLIGKNCENIIYEIIEHQKISIFKSNIDVDLKIDTSIIAFIHSFHFNKVDSNKRHLCSLLYENICRNFDLFFSFSQKFSDTYDYLESINIISNYFNKKNGCEVRRNIYLKNFQYYLYFIQSLKPKLMKKSSNIIINLYKFLTEEHYTITDNLFKIGVNHLNSLVILTEAIAKFYLNLKIEEYHVKAAARFLIFSLCFYNSFDYILFHKEKNLVSNLKKNIDSNKSCCKDIFKITFKEFNMISKNIMNELKKSNTCGIIGLSLKKLLLKIVKNKNESNKNIGNIIKKLKLISLILNNLIFKQNILILVKNHINIFNRKFLNLICLKNH